MLSSFGWAPACARGATASGGVVFMHAVSSLIPSTCFIACLPLPYLLALRLLDKLPRFAFAVSFTPAKVAGLLFIAPL